MEDVYKQLSEEQLALLKKPLPQQAVTPHPTKKFLSTIKAIYVVERFNDVFGVGKWMVRNKVMENPPPKEDGKPNMIVVETTFTVPDYGIQLESYGGNDNVDRGDAYKGAVTDAITKIGSYLGIGMDVFKGLTDRTAPAEILKGNVGDVSQGKDEDIFEFN